MLMVCNEAASFSVSVSLQVDCTVGWHGRRIWFISCNITIWPDAGGHEIRYLDFSMVTLVCSAITLLSSSAYWSQMRLRSLLSLLFVVSHAHTLQIQCMSFAFPLVKLGFMYFHCQINFAVSSVQKNSGMISCN